MTWAAMLSQISVTAIPCCISSQVVKRAPCSSGPRFIGVHMDPSTSFVGGVDGCQCRAILGCGQCTGVAVSQYADTVLPEGCAEAADIAAHGAIFLVDGMRFLQQDLEQLRAAPDRR